MTRVLVIHYSQTGQLTRVLHSMMGPLAANPDVVVEWHDVVPQRAYPFPWGLLSFLDAFPESVSLDPPPVRLGGLDADAQYDLVVLGYQVWFLSPSLPMTGFLKSPHARVLQNKPVITVVACRGLWVTAHRAMLGLLRDAGARLADNVVLTDQSPMWSTFITTPWWLLTGNKGPLLGLFPEAGINAEEIRRAARFGRALGEALPRLANCEAGPFLDGLEAVKVNRLTLIAERIGHRSFRLWGSLVRAAGKPGSLARRPILLAYLCFLVIAILTIMPFTVSVAAIAARFSRKIRDEAIALEQPSGSGTDRLVRFDLGG
jgi:hypothetical protein